MGPSRNMASEACGASRYTHSRAVRLVAVQQSSRNLAGGPWQSQRLPRSHV